MKAAHREQVEFLKKRITSGIDIKAIWRKFRRKWQLSTKTFQRRMAIAKIEMATGKPYSSVGTFVFLNMPDGSDMHGQNGDKNGTWAEGQNSTKAEGQVSTGPKRKITEEEAHQKIDEHFRQQRGKTPEQEAALLEATEKIMDARILNTDQCMYLLSRMALAQCMQTKQVLYKGEVMQLEQLPSFSIRRAAVMAILKYNEKPKKPQEQIEVMYKGHRKYVILEPGELDAMEEEDRRRLNNFFMEGKF